MATTQNTGPATPAAPAYFGGLTAEEYGDLTKAIDTLWRVASLARVTGVFADERLEGLDVGLDVFNACAVVSENATAVATLLSDVLERVARPELRQRTPVPA